MIYAVAVRDTLAVPGTSRGDLDLGEPHPEAGAYLRSLKDAGHEVLIHDSLANTDYGWRLLHDWLLQAGIDSYDDVWMQSGKPVADVYVDNRSEKWDCPSAPATTK